MILGSAVDRLRPRARPRFVGLVGLGLTVSMSGCGDPGRRPPSERTHAGINVLLLTIDTLRADHLSGYGYPRQTSPAIDALAHRGIVFDRAFTYWPKTRGSFAAMFTSRYAAQHGLTVRDRDLPEFNLTLAETLNENGYRTAAAVDNGNLDKALGFAQGFDEYEEAWLLADTELERTELLTRFAERFLGEYEQPDPFFLWIHYVNPHAPYAPPAEELGRFLDDGHVARGPRLPSVIGYHGGVNRHLFVPGEQHLGDYIDRYDAEIAVSDDHLGRVLDALDQSGQRERTLVVFTSDHGESLGEHDYYFDHGFDLYRPSLHVPLVLSLPGLLPQGDRDSAAVSTLDIFPTILDLAQVSFPPGLEGRSLVPLTRGGQKLHDLLYFQNDHHLLALTNGRLKLIANPETRNGGYELYDLWKDPYEQRDLYPTAKAAVAPLEAELQRFRTNTVAWQQETDAKRHGTPARSDDELPEETIRNLKALGYVGGGDSPPEEEPVEEEEEPVRP